MGGRRKTDSELLETSVRASPSASSRARADLEYYLQIRDAKLARQRAKYHENPGPTNERSLANYRANRTQVLPRMRARVKRVRSELISLLGEVCAFCGEQDASVLRVDHKAPILRRGRQVSGTTMGGILAALKKGTENPFNLQLLCANCHNRKTRTERLSLFHHAEGFEYKARKSNARVWNELRKVLGDTCAHCGERDPAVLVVDHVVARGGRWSSPRDTGPTSTLAAIRAGRVSPSALQILCCNCHARKTAAESRMRSSAAGLPARATNPT